MSKLSEELKKKEEIEESYVYLNGLNSILNNN
jgi:hypothetical protein